MKAYKKEQVWMFFRSVLALGILLLGVGCRGGAMRTVSGEVSASNSRGSETTEDTVVVKYAKGFRVRYEKGCKLIDITDPQGAQKQTFRFALVPRGSGQIAPSGYTSIEVPVHRVICMTSLQLSNFIKLGAVDCVVGITSTRFLFNREVTEAVRAQQICKIGIEGNFDNEVVMALQPDVVFVSPFKRGGYEAIKSLDVNLVPHLGYKELTPLGQAEWLKFVGLFLGREHEATAQFEAIVERYDSLKRLVAGVAHRPSVFSGEMHGSNWYVVGGRSFLAQLFADAGADYFLKDDQRSGGVTLDFETVYARAAEIDFWRMVNSAPRGFTYETLKREDNRYAAFRAFKDHRIIYCSMRDKPFYEETPVAPDVVLADLIKLFHPDLLPNYKPVYYELLK